MALENRSGNQIELVIVPPESDRVIGNATWLTRLSVNADCALLSFELIGKFA
jgi:hypothetical protein